MALSIKCCKGCVPPKRYPGCGAKCEEYIKEKEQLKENKKKAKANETPTMTEYDFNTNANFSLSRHKRR